MKKNLFFFDKSRAGRTFIRVISLLLFCSALIIATTSRTLLCAENVGNRYGVDKATAPYTSLNIFSPTYGGQCTAFAWGRALDRLGIITSFSQSYGRHACAWPDLIINSNVTIVYDYTKPRANSFVIWGYDGASCNGTTTGHVAYIEEVIGNDIYK